MSKSFFASAVLTLALFFTPPLHAQAVPDLSKALSGPYVVDQSHTSLLFQISHLGFSDFVGRFNDVDIKLNLDVAAPEKSTVQATVKIASVDTNVKKLDAKLQDNDFFKAAQFPDATFKSTSIAKKGDNMVMNGELTMLGVTRPVALDVRLHGSGLNPFSKAHVVGFAASTTIKRSDWGMAGYIPAVGDEVKISIETELTYAGTPAAAPTTVPAQDKK